MHTARAVQGDLREADRLQQQSVFSEAGTALERARSRLGDGGPFWLYPAVEVARRDHQFLVRLETIRLNRFTLAEAQQGHAALLRFNKSRAEREYAEAFRDQGLGEPPNGPEGAAARVRASRWAAHLIAALDDWAVCTADPARQDWVLTVARRAGPDPGPTGCATRRPGGMGRPWPSWRGRPPWRSSPYLCCWRWANGCRRPVRMGSAFSDASAEHFPEDFWANFTLALALHGAERRPGGDPTPALAYYQKALELRPQAAAVLNDLGVVLFDKDWMWDGAPDGGGPGR